MGTAESARPPKTAMVRTSTVTAYQLLSEKRIRPFISVFRASLGGCFIPECRADAGPLAQCVAWLHDHFILPLETAQHCDPQAVVGPQAHAGEVGTMIAHDVDLASAGLGFAY